MEKRILFNHADDFEREVYRSEFDNMFSANNQVSRRRREQMENNTVNKRRREQMENRAW